MLFFGLQVIKRHKAERLGDPRLDSGEVGAVQDRLQSGQVKKLHAEVRRESQQAGVFSREVLGLRRAPEGLGTRGIFPRFLVWVHDAVADSTSRRGRSRRENVPRLD